MDKPFIHTRVFFFLKKFDHYKKEKIGTVCKRYLQCFYSHAD